MNTDDLELLDTWSTFPAEHRLASCLEAALAGPDFAERCADLASHLGYSRPQTVKQWFSHLTIVPLRHLPAISKFTGIHLSVLLAMWVATYSADDDETGEISEAIKPRITDGEFWIIETARAVFQNEADERLEP